MSTLTPSTTPDMTSDATFRAWGKSISDTILALGWTRTADTGQINWATVSKPTSTYTAGGFEIFQMTDALAGAHPVYLKIEYGCANPISYYWITIQCGTTTNGSGTLGGQVSAYNQLYPTSNPGAAATSLASGSTNRLAYYLWPGMGTNNASFFSVERTHDATGADTSDGYLVLIALHNNLAWSQEVPFAGTVPPVQAQWNATLPPSGSGVSGANTYLYPVRAWGVGESCASLNVFLYFNSDLTANNPVAATNWAGASETVYPSGNTISTTYFGGAGCIAMRWD